MFESVRGVLDSQKCLRALKVIYRVRSILGRQRFLRVSEVFVESDVFLNIRDVLQIQKCLRAFEVLRESGAFRTTEVFV